MSDVTEEQIKLNPNNVNKGTDRGAYMLRESFERVGPRRSVVADKDGVIIAGNQTVKAAREAGIPLEVIPATPDKLVVLQFDDLDIDGDGPEGDKARFYEIVDNRANEVGLDWNKQVVEASLAAGTDVLAMFTEGELARVGIELRETFDAPLAAFASQEQKHDSDSDNGSLGVQDDVEGGGDNGVSPPSPSAIGEEDTEEKPSTSLAKRHVIPIVLDGEQNEKWKEFMQHNQIKDPLKAFLYLLDLFFEPFEQE